MTTSIQQVESFIRLPIVKQRTGLSRSAIYFGIKQGTFPQPINIGPRSVAWPESKISAWIQSKIESSRYAL